MSSVDAYRKASGQLQAFGGGGETAKCPRAPLTGSFDGSTLHVQSPATNLCSERVMELKLTGSDEVTGSYRVGSGELVTVTFTRVK